MKKNVFVMMLAMIMAFVMAGCGSNKGITDIKGTSDDVKSVMTMLAKYDKVEVPASVLEPTAEAVDNQMQMTPYVYKVIEGKTVVEEGDVVNINYKGIMDGEAFDGGTDAGYDLEIGSGSFIPGFEEQLIGKELGGDYELPLTFPEDYWSEEMAGAEVIFEVHINAIQEKMIATDDDIREQLREQNLQASVLHYVMANSEFTIDQGEVDALFEEMMAQYESIGQMVGGMDVYLSYMNMTQEQLDAAVRADIESMIKSVLVIDEIARQEGLATEEEILQGTLEDGTAINELVRELLAEKAVVKE